MAGLTPTTMWSASRKSSPSSLSGGFEGIKATQHKYEWEREIETLDKQEQQVHHSQMKLIREQMTTFIACMATLREEIAQLQTFREAVLKDPLRQDVAALVEELRGEVRGHGEDLKGVSRLVDDLHGKHSRLEDLHGRVAACERNGSGLKDLHGQHATISERVELLERMMGETGEKQAQDLIALRAAHDNHANIFSQHSKDYEALKSSIPERLNYLEKIVGDSADQHQGKLDSALEQLGHLHGRLSACEQHGNSLSKAHNDHKNGLLEHHATLNQRVDFLERMLGDSADKHQREIEDLKNNHDKHMSALSKHAKMFEDHKGALHGHHLSQSERVDELERIIGTYADQHGQGLAEAHAKLEQMHGRVAACERLPSHIEDLKRSHGTLAKEKEELHGRHESLKERLHGLDAALTDHATKSYSELQNLKNSHEKHGAAFLRHQKELEGLRSERNGQHAGLAERLAAMEQHHGDTVDKHNAGLSQAHSKLNSLTDKLAAYEKNAQQLGQLQRAHESLADKKKELESHHATIAERVKYLEQMLGDSADKHSRELDALKNSHSKHASDLDNLKNLHHRASSVDERLNYLEQLVGDSFDKHAEELGNLRRSHDSLHHRLGQCEGHGNSLQELQKSHSSLMGEKAMLDNHHATLKERVTYLEGLLNDSADKHSNKLDQAHTRLDEMHGRLSSVEKIGPALMEIKRGHSDVTNHAKMLATDHAALKDRLDNVEAVFGDAANRQTKDLVALKTSHANHANMLTKHAANLDSFQKHHEHHASLPERVGYLEQLLNDSADKHAAEVQKLHDKIAKEALAREKHHGSVKDLLNRHEEDRGQHHATIAERLKYLEGVLHDSADKHARELSNMSTQHQKLTSELRARGDHHGTIAERLDRLENSMVEVAERHARDMKLVQTKWEHVSSRFQAIKGAWSMQTPRSP